MTISAITTVRRARLQLLLLCAVATAGCAARAGTQADAQPRATLRVDNQSTNEMTMYVRRGAARVRLGVARALGVTVLRIPTDVVGFGALLRFEGDPLAGRGNPLSEEISVAPGDSVQIVIPPR